MSGKKSRNKGKRGEREAARLMSDLLGVPVTRGVQYKGTPESPDLAGLDQYGLHAEVKRDERTVSASMYKAIEQSRKESGGLIPFVLARKNNESWVLAIEVSNLVEFSKRVLLAHENDND
jgi:hypothetical protein